MKELKKSLFPVFEDQFQLPRSRGGGLIRYRKV